MSEEENKNCGRPMNILLVEDNKADVKIALRAFNESKLKNKVYVVKDGQEALDYIFGEGQYRDRKKFPLPDLILLDINMPRVDGFQVLDRLKNDLQYNFIPVVMLTSSKNEEDIAKSYKIGASSYIPKPVSYEEFLKVVDGFNYYWHTANKLPDLNRSK